MVMIDSTRRIGRQVGAQYQFAVCQEVTHTIRRWFSHPLCRGFRRCRHPKHSFEMEVLVEEIKDGSRTVARCVHLRRRIWRTFVANRR
jgi:hypothetical protein